MPDRPGAATVEPSADRQPRGERPGRRDDRMQPEIKMRPVNRWQTSAPQERAQSACRHDKPRPDARALKPALCRIGETKGRNRLSRPARRECANPLRVAAGVAESRRGGTDPQSRGRAGGAAARWSGSRRERLCPCCFRAPSPALAIIVHPPAGPLPIVYNRRSKPEAIEPKAGIWRRAYPFSEPPATFLRVSKHHQPIDS